MCCGRNASMRNGKKVDFSAGPSRQRNGTAGARPGPFATSTASKTNSRLAKSWFLSCPLGSSIKACVVLSQTYQSYSTLSGGVALGVVTSLLSQVCHGWCCRGIIHRDSHGAELPAADRRDRADAGTPAAGLRDLFPISRYSVSTPPASLVMMSFPRLPPFQSAANHRWRSVGIRRFIFGCRLRYELCSRAREAIPRL